MLFWWKLDKLFFWIRSSNIWGTGKNYTSARNGGECIAWQTDDTGHQCCNKSNNCQSYFEINKFNNIRKISDAHSNNIEKLLVVKIDSTIRNSSPTINGGRLFRSWSIGLWIQISNHNLEFKIFQTDCCNSVRMTYLLVTELILFSFGFWKHFTRGSTVDFD